MSIEFSFRRALHGAGAAAQGVAIGLPLAVGPIDALTSHGFSSEAITATFANFESFITQPQNHLDVLAVLPLAFILTTALLSGFQKPRVNVPSSS